MTARLALLVGVPIELRAFVHAALDPARHFARQFAFDPVSVWEGDGGYQVRVAAPVARLLEHAERIGAVVKPRAVLADLTEATTMCDVVMVFAHWKGSDVALDDLPAAGPAVLPGLLRRAVNHEPRTWGQDFLALGERLERIEPCDGHAAVAILNEYLRRPALELGGVAQSATFPVAVRHQTVEAERRAALDAVLEGQLRPGNCLELCDGLHGMDRVESALDDAFGGVLDLTTCQSTMLARRIDRARGGSCRIVQFESALETETACLTLQQTLAVLEAHAPHEPTENTCGQGESGRSVRLEDVYLAARAQAVDDVAEALSALIHASDLGSTERFAP